MPGPGEITQLLSAARAGDRTAESELMTLVYDELRSLARRHMSRERREHTLQPTALVHETWLRLVRSQSVELHDRVHFFATAATVMRRVLVDQARERKAAKRPGAQVRVELDDRAASETPDYEQMIMLDEALDQLAAAAPRQARIVEMMFFAQMEQQDVADALGYNVKTIKRDWSSARAWLQARLRQPPQ